MRILVTGCNGQVGWEVARSCQPLGEVLAADRSIVDLARPDALAAAVRHLRPDVIVNTAAYTAVDAAEDDEASARRVNAEAVGVLADEASRIGALLVHYSTDYVFDGTKEGPYVESDTPDPLGAYGRTKLAGENALAASRADWLCLRTSWVYAARGKNFLRTILRLAAEREELRIVADQVGAPTSARLVADVTAHVVARAAEWRRRGTFAPAVLHATAGGATSWHQFAARIVELARAAPRAPALKVQRVVPIGAAEYPTKARRPANSRMDCSELERRFGVRMPGWERGVELTVAEVLAGG